MALVPSPNTGMVYSEHEFLDKIGMELGKVVGVDKKTTNVERGCFMRQSVKVDVSRLTISKFRLKGRVYNNNSQMSPAFAGVGRFRCRRSYPYVRTCT